MPSRRILGRILDVLQAKRAGGGVAAAFAAVLVGTAAAAQLPVAPESQPPAGDARPAPPHEGDPSERLERSEGVIKPPPTGDAEIHVPPKEPDTGAMPVIPPPGTPGGRQDVRPK